jgi:ubiquitin fusion degradation protein 1
MFNFFQGAGRPAAPRGPFRTRLRVFSVGCKDREDLECGDKILLPSSALETLVQLEIAYPMMFRLTNPETGLLVHCGVLEFVAEEGHCYIPYWMMSHLAVDEGGVVELLNVDLPKGTFVQFQPHSYTFNELSNPRAVLERGLRGYAVLNKGTTIPITHVNRTFHLDVALLEPADAVLIIETDINVDFAEAKDYAKRKQQLDAEKRARAAALPPTPASSGSSSLSGAAAPSFATHTPTSAPMFEFGKRLPTASGLGSPAPGAGSGAASPFAGTGSVLGTGASSGSAVGAGAGAGGALTLATSGLGSGASSAMGTPTIPASGTAAGGGGYFARLGAGHSL